MLLGIAWLTCHMCHTSLGCWKWLQIFWACAWFTALMGRGRLALADRRAASSPDLIAVPISVLHWHPWLLFGVCGSGLGNSNIISALSYVASHCIIFITLNTKHLIGYTTYSLAVNSLLHYVCYSIYMHYVCYSLLHYVLQDVGALSWVSDPERLCNSGHQRLGNFST